jgi:hypothetical protein
VCPTVAPSRCVPSGAWRTKDAVDEREELLDRVRALRAQRYTPVEIARALVVGKAEAARLVRAVASEDASRAPEAGPSDADGRGAANQPRCWVSPGWRHGLRIEGHADWPDDIGAPAEAVDSGVACVLLAAPDGHSRVSVYGYLVDTWCLGVKNALGPKRMSTRDLVGFRRRYFGHWRSEGIPIPLELAQHLVLGSVAYARRLGFEPQRDFRRARRPLGSWEGPSAITFGMDGKPHYLNGPHDDPERVVATLERTVGRGGYHYTVSLDEFDGLDGGYHYTVSVSDRDGLSEVA